MSSPSLFCLLLVLIGCVIVSSATDADLSLEIYTIFNPMPFMVTFETGTNVSINVMSITVRNNGPDDLPSLGSGQIHYEMGMYITALEGDKMLDPVQVDSFSLNDDVVLRRANGIVAGGDQAYQVPDWPTAVINYPAEKCKTHSHLCVVLEHVDVVPVTLTITNAELPTFVYDTPSEVMLDIKLHNAGGTTVPGGVENLGFSAFIASDNSMDADFQVDCGDVNVNSTTLLNSIGPWSDTVYSDVRVTVTIPQLHCSDFNYLCIVFKKASDNATFEDDDSNNLICLPFDEVADGGAGAVVCPSEDPDQETPAKFSMGDVALWALLGVACFLLVSGILLFLCFLCLTFISVQRKKNKVDVEQQNHTVVIDVNKVENTIPTPITAWEIQYM
ncbi:uncharacterized protein [Ptychodera flava]|uniref:uncharacterized protein n=1 Tax=Ptychodera flava TaxID=63121 RepID=UPI00396A95CA